MPSQSKTQVLTGSQVALPNKSTNGVHLFNSTAVALNFVVNGGDTATLLASQEVKLDVNNSNQITVSGTGTLTYFINTIL